MIAGDDILNNVVNQAEDMVVGDHNEAKDTTEGSFNHYPYYYITARKMPGNKQNLMELMEEFYRLTKSQEQAGLSWAKLRWTSQLNSTFRCRLSGITG